MSVHVSVLQQFGLLRTLATEVLQELAEASTLSTWARRQVLLDKTRSTDALFFLLEGRLQATDFTLDGKEVVLFFVDEGDYFGEVSMLDGLPNPEIVVASRKSVVVQVPSDRVRPLALSIPAMSEAITLGLAQRLRLQSESRQILSINNPLQRVCAQLLLLARGAFGTSTLAPMTEIAQAPTHQELAMMVNLSRETVTRVFQALQSQGAVDRQSEGLRLDMTMIEELAHRVK